MTKHQILRISVPITIAINAITEDDAYDILNKLNKEEILKLALHQLPFEEAQTSMSLQ